MIEFLSQCNNNSGAKFTIIALATTIQSSRAMLFITTGPKTKKTKKAQCLSDLRITDPRHDKIRIESTKGGLLEDSYSWIFEHSDFQQWHDNTARPLLWIKGDPGKGKTCCSVEL